MVNWFGQKWRYVFLHTWRKSSWSNEHYGKFHYHILRQSTKIKFALIIYDHCVFKMTCYFNSNSQLLKCWLFFIKPTLLFKDLQKNSTYATNTLLFNMMFYHLFEFRSGHLTKFRCMTFLHIDFHGDPTSIMVNFILVFTVIW